MLLQILLQAAEQSGAGLAVMGAGIGAGLAAIGAGTAMLIIAALIEAVALFAAVICLLISFKL